LVCDFYQESGYPIVHLFGNTVHHSVKRLASSVKKLCLTLAIMKRLSVIVPVWNEESNIQFLVRRIHETMQKNKITYEIVFIDDHSTDNTIKIINQLKNSFPISVYTKQGKQGKAYSIMEGCTKVRYETIAMIDADLQYPPEALAGMLDQIHKGADIVVAKRQYHGVSKIRRVVSKGFQFVFGKMLFRLDHDVQAGLKVFRKEVIATITFAPVSGWTFDLEFLHRASEAGYTIENCDIIFEKRKNGASKISLMHTSLEIGLNALAVKTKNIFPQHVSPTEKNTMLGAGIGFKRKKYITHTTLHHSQSAIRTFILRQLVLLGIVAEIAAMGAFLAPLLTVQILIGVLSFIYFIDVLFNFYLIWKSLHVPQEITFSAGELYRIDESSLPVYSILCPLYKEAHVIPQFLQSINKLSWPKEKLDVLLLLEEDDKESIEKIKNITLPPYVRTVIVPHSMPKTKPKACNYGLGKAKGEYLVIYDAEDMPDPLQLKKAYLGFQKAGSDVRCLQAKLNYYNPHQNLLTRFFTAEYSLWFDITLTGLQSIGTSIPLGGTSNHFKTKDLISLQGWDPFNVTEDADLGIRLFKQGYKTAIIDSTTLEEANSKLINWIRQRSRWIKGYMQTYLVHTRELFFFRKNQGMHGLLFHLIIGGKIAFILINPILWTATVAYFALYAIVGPTIESFYPRIVFYMAAFSLVFGNFLFLYYYMIGCAKRNQWELVKYVYLAPLYWLLISIAGGMAIYQLIFKPHYWEKTVHGLHLKKKVKQQIAEAIIEVEESQTGFPFPNSFRRKLAALIANNKGYISGGWLIFGNMAANFLNFLFNAYLGRALNFEDFSLISLISVLTYLSYIPLNAFAATVNFKSGFLEGKFSRGQANIFWKYICHKAFFIGIAIAGIWLLLNPLLVRFFQEDQFGPFLLFNIIWMIGFIAAADRGFLSGRFRFGSLAILLVADPIFKLLLAALFIHTGKHEYTYATIPITSVFTFIVGWILVNKEKSTQNETPAKEVKSFPKKFYLSSVSYGLTSLTFLSLDIVLAKHFLPTEEAGKYALISLVGKMVFFLGSLASQFILPIVSRNEGANKNSKKTLQLSLLSTFVLSLIAYIAFGQFGYLTIPFLFGKKTLVILPYLAIFCFAMMCFTVSRVFATYYLAQKIYTFAVAGFVLTLLQIVLITLLHGSVSQVVTAMVITSFMNLALMAGMHMVQGYLRIFESNVSDFIGLFTEERKQKVYTENSLRLLIFNWRDMKHKWAGGAEYYIHEIAKYWVKDGNTVTVFCGNDGHHPRNETIDGVHIIRRGGFYTVYIWAALYYVLKFRGNFDVIIDSENGIPFFTPLYSRKPVFLLIHHIHQEVFREHLKFPFSNIAQFIESKVMPVIYKNKTVITVSDSSKQEIEKIKRNSTNDIEVIHPGINTKSFAPGEKTPYASFLYLGRLKPYKNIDIAIKAFSIVTKKNPDAKLIIAGYGESFKSLNKLVQSLYLTGSVTFLGPVSEKVKTELLTKSWMVIQPSMIEGWGITVIEANASGTPVIASDVNGLRDSIIHERTGILVPVKDIEGFAAAMQKGIQDTPLLKKLSENAYVWSQNFSWEKSAKQFYKKIMHQLSKAAYVRSEARLLYE